MTTFVPHATLSCKGCRWGPNSHKSTEERFFNEDEYAGQNHRGDILKLGTDFPYLSGDGYRRSVSYIQDAGLSTSGAHRILDTNAASLLQLERR